MLISRRGSALALSLVSVSVLIVLSTSYVSRVVQEKNLLDREVRAAKAAYAAEAGGQAGLYGLKELINNYMLNTVNLTNPATVSNDAATFVAASNGLGFLIRYVKDSGGTALLTQIDGATASPPVKPAVMQAVYPGTSQAIDNGTYIYTIRIWQKSNPVGVAANLWDFPFYFKIESTGVNGSQASKTSVQGDFTVRVQKDNFARYALFTNAQTMSDGTTQVWFTNSTIFSGPVFTNGRFNFAYNPSGVFYDMIHQSAVTARFYNNNSPVLLDANNNGNIDVPEFSDGFSRGAAAIAMPTATDETSMASQASAGTVYAVNGIYLPMTGTTLKGGVYVRGDASVAMSVDASSRQVLTITQGATTKTITIDKTANQTLVKTGAGLPVTYTGLPDGVGGVGTIVYVNGKVTAFSGTVQSAHQMTVASHSDIVISNNVLYESFTPAVGTPGLVGYVAPTAEGSTNLLGLVSWIGNIRLGNTTPSNVQIHGTLMAKSGVVQVDNYDSLAIKGKATILGGVISNNYGAFGTFNSGTGAAVSGYGRNFVYDTRMATAMTPPYFPTLNTFIAFTNDIMDKLTWQQGGF